MTITPLKPRRTETDPPDRLARGDAESLGERIQQQAAVIAEATCELLLMVGDFDARGGVGWYVGLKSTAHWLAWACSMSPGTAREHVRVARALDAMPLTVAEFRAGRLSYSKVREITRVAGRVDEETLVDLARAMTASQLARTISSFRAVDGSRLGQDAVRQARWQTRDDGMVEIRAVLPAEMGAELITALDLALDRDGHDPTQGDPPHRPEPADAPDGPKAPDGADVDTAYAAQVTTTPTLEQRKADALVSLARTFLDTEPNDRSGEDRHLVVVQVSAEALTENAPAGTPQHCGALGQGPLETRTAERLACTGKISVMITDKGGEILYLGRSQRLASRAQRRALRLRDTVCNFPGCHQTRHLDAHHTTPWSEGGLTDIEGLALLCRRHHVMVHEGGLRLALDPDRTNPLQPRFQVLDTAGKPVQARWPAMLEHLSLHSRPETDPADTTDPDADPERIAATTGGAGFRLADCVDALCRNVMDRAA